MITLEARFLQYVMPVTESGCWLWIGGYVRHGYGGFNVSRMKNSHAHRVAYELWKGPIPPKFDVDHLCRVKCCVNPDHLEAVSHRENVLRGEGLAAKEAKRTHCVRGHEYSDSNTVRFPKHPQKRYCRTCIKQYNERLRQRRRQITATVTPVTV